MGQDQIPAWLEAAAAIVVFLIGGGTIGPWLARRFRQGQHAEMAQTFATLKELNGMGERFKVIEGAQVRHELRLGDVEDKVATLEVQQANHWERIAERMAETAKTLERVTDKVDSISTKQATLEGEMASRRRSQ